MRVKRPSALLVPWLCVALCLITRVTHAQTIAVQGDHFTVDKGDGAGPTPKYLVFISYFDGMRAAYLSQDLDYIANTLYFDGIRVFPNWSPYDSSYCAQPGTDTLIDSNGNIRGDTEPATGRLQKLYEVLDAARARGLIVDVTFNRESIDGGADVAAYKKGLKRVAGLLAPYRNLIFDLQNERDKSGAQHLSNQEVKELRDAVLDADPNRIVVASSSSATSTTEARVLASDDQTNGAYLSAIAYHDSRDTGWQDAVGNTVTSLRELGKPVYLQEPMPWSSGLTICGATEPNQKDADGSADHFRTAAANARRAGAAAWTFHTRQSFRLSNASLKDLIRANGAERDLLEGAGSTPRLSTSAASPQWGINVPVRVTLSGTGTGVITSVPTGINCGIDSAGVAFGQCSGAFPYASTVTLLATAANGSTFVGWSGECSGTAPCALTVVDDTPVSVQFDLTSAPTETVQYYHLDAIGSVRLITDVAAHVVDAPYDYTPFGQDWSVPGVPDRRRFAGKEHDDETSFNYFGARYYDSHTGRFMAVDPIMSVEQNLVEPQKWNRYAYVTNNPLRFTDPDGRDRMGIYAYGAKVTPWRGWKTELLEIGAVAGAIVAPMLAPEIAGATVSCFLSLPCQQNTLEAISPPGAVPRITPTGDIDAAATALAKKLGGQASVAIEGFGKREFDVVSRQFVGQTFSGTSALLKPDNFLSSSRRDQIRVTLEAAKATGRTAYFEFRNGVHDDVLEFIRRNAERIGVKFDISQ